ncbi:predicted protein [Scheffersomyces stipitis CBS 6054]|uniref:ABC1 atypical kinase-like domain-containing protein n=1 Tax=Scheffersomyces stipitis (strain ATCC 58785 / CBS 6054 / NBRC 10063 / NRRL Y-11545) TaxID=322104 RepID=A3LVP9_PICST|nr:predicted protein [Scheffersomyces stipitis CBS 6054]ABN66818.2 predicted protein [Scheffersomyces stipitis CBS 6054]KAG2734532.1 hypothetical protein G9P44_002538 [Scheffersomyces stipitis]
MLSQFRTLATRLRVPARNFSSNAFKSKAVPNRSFAASKSYRLVIRPTAILVGVGGSVYIFDQYAYSSLITRSVRALYVLLWIAYEYGMNLDAYQDLNVLHEKASESLLNLLRVNKGLYIKLGQAIANQGNVFPVAYQKRFSQLYDDAPLDSWDRIDAQLKRNFGPDYESKLFEVIDHEPVASASIAQVHRAVLKESGKTVALKVQHDYIEKQVVVDLWVYKFMSKVYERVFDIPCSSFTSYVADQIVKETDFVHEMGNGDKLKQIIQSDPQLRHVNVYVPHNYPEFTTNQVLVTEWIEGISLIDKDKLLDKGFDLSLIMGQYLNFFGKQIFKYGFVHSDPHPGNLLARFDEHGTQQLVLLDHGLYISLPTKFRLEYCNLWRYLFSFKKQGIEEIARSWGVNSVEFFSTLVQLRPIALDPQDAKLIKDERDVNSLFRDFLSDETKFPLEFLFLTRTMRMIQNLNQSFGSPVNRINLLTQESINALMLEKKVQLREYFELLQIRVTLFFSNMVFLFIRFRQILLGDRYGGKGIGLEDYIEVYMQNTARSLGFDYVEV